MKHKAENWPIGGSIATILANWYNKITTFEKNQNRRSNMGRSIFNLNCEDCSTRLNSIFSNLNKDEMIRFSASKSCLNYEKGQLVFAEGGNPRGLYIINSGKVKISKYFDEGKEQIVRLAKEGGVIGYRALLSGEMYSCSATAIEKVSLCFIPKDTLLVIIAGNGELAFKMMKLLANDLKKAEKTIANLTHKTVRERMAEALVILKETYGCENDNCTIKVNFSRTEIGNFIGITRETATRILYEFKSDGILELKGNKISVINQKELLNTANIFD